MSTIDTVHLNAGSAAPYGSITLLAESGLVFIWLNHENGRMGFRFEVSPACARDLAASLLAAAAATSPKGRT